MGGKEGWQTHWPRSPPQQEDEKRKGWGRGGGAVGGGRFGFSLNKLN